jgi:drug/metabolite transporter (DMT)-like permease
MNFLFGSIYVLAAVLIFTDISYTGIKGSLAAVYVGTFEMGFTFILWLAALKLSKDTARISNLIYLSPFLSLIFINIIVGENIYLTTLIGLLLIVSGIVLQRFASGKSHLSKRNDS